MSEDKANEAGRDASPPSDEAAAPKTASIDMTAAIICPVCGAVAAQEKCKIVCRSKICRGRVIMNCSEF